MTKKEKLQVQAFLTGRIPLELQGETIPVPSDTAIKNWLCNASPDLVHLIGRGPNGDTFRKNANAALARITAKESERKPASNGRIQVGMTPDRQPECGPDEFEKRKKEGNAEARRQPTIQKF